MARWKRTTYDGWGNDAFQTHGREPKAKTDGFHGWNWKTPPVNMKSQKSASQRVILFLFESLMMLAWHVIRNTMRVSTVWVCQISFRSCAMTVSNYSLCLVHKSVVIRKISNSHVTTKSRKSSNFIFLQLPVSHPLNTICSQRFK